jgi:hypothetical protein
MQSGTAIGLLVGGAVLILAAAPRAATVPGMPAQPAPGGALNPFNWFSGAMSQPQQQQAPQAGAMPAYSPTPTAGSQGGGGQSPRTEDANYTSPYGTGMGSQAYGSPSFQNASYTQPQSPSSYSPMYGTPYGYAGYGGWGAGTGGYQNASYNTGSSGAYSPSYSA